MLSLSQQNQLQARLAANGRDTEALMLLGAHDCSAGNTAQGLARMEQAVALAPDNWQYHYNLGAMYERVEAWESAIERTVHAARLAPGNADIWFALGELHARAGQSSRALEAYRKTLAIAPQHDLAKQAMERMHRSQLKAWHFSMMNDAPRNQFYERGINAAVRGKTVLEIGAGSGLLSMMAARAGASHVYACEMVPMIAEKAAQIVANNGLGDRITILSTSSFDLQPNTPAFPVRADVLITETFDSRLVGENILAIVADAKARLLMPDAIIVPAHASIMGMLVESTALYALNQVNDVGGFDLSAFNEFRVRQSLPVFAGNYAFTALCQPLEMVRFDFTRDSCADSSVHIPVQIQRNGTCHAAVTWIRLDTGTGNVYENSPLHPWNTPQLHWLHAAQVWENPFTVRAGAVVALNVDTAKNPMVEIVEA